MQLQGTIGEKVILLLKVTQQVNMLKVHALNPLKNLENPDLDPEEE